VGSKPLVQSIMSPDEVSRIEPELTRSKGESARTKRGFSKRSSRRKYPLIPATHRVKLHTSALIKKYTLPLFNTSSSVSCP
jgi:hypothetical protein